MLVSFLSLFWNVANPVSAFAKISILTSDDRVNA